MKCFAHLAVLGAAFVAAVPYASSTPVLIYGKINTAGAANYTFPPNMFYVASNGSASLDLVTSGVPVGTTTGIVTGPPAQGNLAAFYPSAVVTDYSFATSTISTSTPTAILSLANGTDTVTFYATGTGAYTPTNIPTTEGTLVLYGFLSDVGSSYTTNTGVELDIAANGIGNNFTEDLIAPTPEPGSLMLLGTGLLGGAGMLLRRRRMA